MPESGQFNISILCCTVKTGCINIMMTYLLDAGVRRHDGFTKFTIPTHLADLLLFGQ